MEVGEIPITAAVDNANHALAAMAGVRVGTLFAVEEDRMMLQRVIRILDTRTVKGRTSCLIGIVNVGKLLVTLAPTGWLHGNERC